MFTLITACMNREDHLRQNLPKWLKLPNVDEVIVVDWSNRRFLGDLRSIDPRVKVIRVEGEAKWILSYAYNLGISHAQQPLIIKCDADCILSPAVVELIPGTNYFFAGYWKSGAAVNKSSVNGQCIFSKAQFDAVNGYSEIIRTYGRDDEDFYDRLIAAGHTRREIPPRLLDFIGHSDAERTVNQFVPSQSSSTEPNILTGLLYNEMHNAFIARLLPWGVARPRIRYETIQTDDRLFVFRRNQIEEISIPVEIEREAHLFALRCLASNVANLPAGFTERLDERGCMSLITARRKTQSALGNSSGRLVRAL